MISKRSVKFFLLIAALHCGSSGGGDSASSESATDPGLPVIKIQKLTGGPVDLLHGSSTHSFGYIVSTFTSSPVEFKIQNTGGAALNLTGTGPNYVTLTGTNASEFEIVQQPLAGSIGTGAAGTTGLNFSVRFKPLSVSGLAKTATVNIKSNAPYPSTYTFTVTGFGINAPEINLKQAATNIATGGAYAFANTLAGVNNDITFTIENTGTGILELTGLPAKVQISGTDAAMFTVSTPPVGVINGSSTTTFIVRFVPASSGAKSAVLTIANNDTNEGSYVINISGTGTVNSAPCVEVYNSGTKASAAGGSVADFYDPGVTLFSTDGIVASVAFARPAIFYVTQNNPTGYPIFASIRTSLSPLSGYYIRGGFGAGKFATMFPYGSSGSEFMTNWFGAPASPAVNPTGTSTIYFDINSPVNFGQNGTTPASFTIVRSCLAAPSLFEEKNFTATAGTTSSSGLSKIWQVRKKLNVKLIFVQGTYPTYSIAGMQDAVNRMTSIYAQDSVKIDLQFTATSISAAEFQNVSNLSDETGTLTGSLNKLYQSNMGSAQATDSLNIYITGDNTESAGVLGISAGIPGVPGITGTQKAGMIVFLEAHRTSGSAASALAVADLQFLGDTMAHEAAHYLGLFHTNERGGYDAAESMFGTHAKDALIETPYCARSRDAVINGGNNDGLVDMGECLGTGFSNSGALNLMFWSGDGVTAQTQLTGEQGWILRSNPLAY